MDDYEYISNQLDRALELREEPFKDKSLELTLTQLEKIASKFNYNIYEAKENLRLKEQEIQAIRSDVKSEKERVKLLKSNIESKMIQLKGEIDKLNESNHQMEEQIGKKNLPLILKLMGSLS